MADDRAIPVKALMREIEQRSGAEDTLVVIPQGAMINYLMRRRNPPPHPVFDPLVVALYGEGRMLDELRAAAPEFVALIPLDMSEHGVTAFGLDFGQELYRWLSENYEEAWRIGARPASGEGDWVLLSRRNRP